MELAGIVYIIRNLVDNKVYIGSTTRPLHERIREHRVHQADRPLYRAFRVLGRDNFEIEVLEQGSYADRKALTIREGDFIKAHVGCLYNMCVAGRTHKETNLIWRLNNRERQNELNRASKLRCKIARQAAIAARDHIIIDPLD